LIIGETDEFKISNEDSRELPEESSFYSLINERILPEN
jgi:hypothetical protein